MNVILISALCVLAVQMTVSHETTDDKPCRMDHCHLPKIPGCCEFLEAFHNKMAELKQNPDESCKRFPELEKREECKMEKVMTARSEVHPSPLCKERLQAFVEGNHH